MYAAVPTADGILTGPRPVAGSSLRPPTCHGALPPGRPRATIDPATRGFRESGTGPGYRAPADGYVMIGR